MIKLKFMLAQKEDLDNVLAMVTDAINEMNRNGIDQWDNIYPDRNILENDIIKKIIYRVIWKKYCIYLCVKSRM